MSKKTWLALVPLLLLGSATGAQEKEKEKEKPEAVAKQPLTPVKLQVVFSRYMDEKKISSLPYTLSLNANGRFGRLRMGIQVPIQTTVNNIATTVYKDATNNVDCGAESQSDGRFKVSCSLEQSSLYAAESSTPKQGIGPASLLGGTPVLRTFRSEAELLLRDGQTAQYTAAADPVSGELLKIDITLTVVK